MRHDDAAQVSNACQTLQHGVCVGGLAPGKVDAGDVRAKGFRNFGETIAEGANGNGRDGVAWRKDIDDGGFHRASSRRWKGENIAAGLEEILELLGDAVEDDGEFWAAMIDHRAGHRLENHGRDGCGSRDAQVDFFFLRGLNHLAVLAGTTRGALRGPADTSRLSRFR